MTAINIELLDALKKAGVDEQKGGQSRYAAGVFKGLIRLASTLQEVSVHFDKISAVNRHLDDEDAVREPPKTIQLHGTGDDQWGHTSGKTS